VSWAGGWLPRAYFGLWFGDTAGASGPVAAGPPFVWLVAADGRSCVLAQDQAATVLAADGWQAQLVEFAEAELAPDAWTAALKADLVAVSVSDDPTAALAADSWMR